MSMNTLSDLSPMSMFLKADWVVQSVMVLLILASVLSWTVWLVKSVQLHCVRRRTARLTQRLNETDRLEDIFTGPTDNLGPEFQMVAATQRECCWLADSREPVPAERVKERVAQRLNNTETQQAAELGKGIGILASVSSTAPFIGLFGTVWGIMNSFIGIASTKTTDLSVVAPGIAEALLATAAGLIAAIPAALFYNHFSRRIADYRRNLGAISSELMVLLSRYLDQQRLGVNIGMPKPTETAVRQTSLISAEDRRHGHVAAAKAG